MLQPKKKLDTGHYRTTTGNVVIYGTPEYKKAYDKGEVITDKGVKSPVTIQGQKLKEVVVKNNYKRNSLEEYKDKIIEENKDSGVLGAIIGTPISAVTSLPQLFATKALTGKMQRPSEAMNIKNPYGAAVVDAVTDPANLIGAGVLTKEKALARLAASKESGLLSNAYKHNPWAFKPNESKWYRQVGESAINDAKTLKQIRESNEVISPENWKSFQNQIKDLQGNPDITDHFERMKAQINAGRRPNAPFFQKGSLFYPMDRKPVLTSKNPAAKGSSDFLIESNLPNESFQPAYVKGMNVGVPKEVGTTAILKPDPNLRNIENFNIYKKDWLQGYKKLQQGGYINQNTNMNRYAQGGDLTQFNEGGLHSQNPLGGVPIGNNNSVEQGETKSGNFVYSNRIFLDSNIVSQYNLPKSLIGKSVADATKFIDNKFKGRNDKISQSTKNGMLSKIAEAQEAMKPQEPEMEQSQEGMIDPTQMALGGYVNRQMNGGGWYDQNNPYFMQNPGMQQPNMGPMNQIQPVSQLSQANSLSQIKPFSTGNQLPTASAVPDTAGAIGGGLKEMSGKTGLGLSSALGAASTAIDLGKTAFGKPAQNTDGLAASAPVDKVGMIGGSTLKGLKAGMAFGPWGAGIGAVVGGVAGLLGAGKAKKAAIKNSNNFALNTNRQFSDQYALGGEIDPPTKITVDNLINTPIVTGVKPISQSDRFRYAVGEQSGVQHGTSGEQGHYLYYGKKPGDSGFNPSIHREFVNQGGYDTYMKSPQGQQYRRNLSTQSLQPIEQLGCGGKVKKMAGGGPVLPKPPTADYDTNIIQNFQDGLGMDPKTPGYGVNFGKLSNQLYFNDRIKRDSEYAAVAKKKGLTTDHLTNSDFTSDNIGETSQKRFGLTPQGYKFTPETPVFPQKTDPVITPTQTKAGFEAYANAKQVEDAKKNKSLAGKALSYTNDNLGNLARYAPIAANALQLAQLKKPQGERLDRLSNRYKPEYVDEAALQNIADQTMNNSVNAIGQSGASQGQLRSSIIGSQLQRNKAISDAYMNAAAQNRATNDRAQTFNLGVDQVNLQQSNTEKENYARDQAAYRNAKREYITGIGEGIGDIGKEQVQKKIIAKTTGYRWDGTYVKDTTGNIVTDPTTGKPMTEEKLKEIQSIKDKKALGGYLIKNKVK